MAVRTIEQLKSFFRRGMYPTEQNFADLCESFVHRAEKLGITTSPSEVLVKNHSSSEYIPLPAATTERAGVMSAEDKGKVEHIRDVETIAIAAINKIDTEQFGGTLGLYIERGEDDYTLPLPLATTSTAGVMSASDKSRLNTLMEDGVRNLRLEINPSNGVVYLQYAGSEGPVDIVLPTVTPSTNGLMSAGDKRKLDATATSLFKITNDISTHIERITQRLNENKPLIPMDINIVNGAGGKVLELQGNIPEGYTPVVFRKIRRTTKTKDVPRRRPSQWYFYGTANLVEEGGKRFVSFQNPFRENKLVAPFSDHNFPPSPVGAISQAHDFVFIHNVDENGEVGGQAGYPEKFDLRVSWGRSGRRKIFTQTQSPPHKVRPATICLELGIGLVKTEIYQATYVSYTRKRRITREDLASIFVPFKIVTQEPDEWPHTHTYKPKWYFTT